MRNLKKILALALVFAMAFTFTAGAASFTDAADIGTNYVDDVNMLVELGVIAGYPDGSFGPQNNITRAEFAKMAYTLKYGSDADGNLFAAQKSNFTDVEGNANVAWAKGYINYCANQNIVSGVGNNKFNPQGNITVAEAAKMILVILGCDPAKEGFTGANWMSNVVAKAIELGIFNGWAGDPSQLATRELVAKLMKNAIFSPVYTYSAITGAGSQMDALGQNDNKTLGETTMGLKTVTGIVVANETNFISTNEDGEGLNDVVAELGVDLKISETGEDSGKSVIYYIDDEEEEESAKHKKLVIDRALSDDMLGNKVNVFFKADKIENNNRYDTKGVEVIGNVLVHSDTVVYEVPAIAADIYPDDESRGTSKVRPYITLIVDGEEKKFDIDVNDKIAKENDAQEDENVIKEINKYAYYIDGIDKMDADNGSFAKSRDSADDKAFIEDLGTTALSQYRFVSVDGGKTLNYMFKTVDDEDVVYGAVTNMNSSSIRITGDMTANANIDVEDAVINGDVAVDDYVVAYRENGKVVINKVEPMNAAVESFTDKGVVLGGNEFFPWATWAATESVEKIFDYYDDYRNAMEADTAYYTYGNIILDINADEEVAATANYAMILRAFWDDIQEMPYVKLGFADGTIATYQVGKLFSAKDYKDTEELFSTNGSELENVVVSYKIMDNGQVDLSDQDLFKNGSGKYYDKTTLTMNAKNLDIKDGKLIVNTETGAGHYGLNDSTVVFVRYEDDGEDKVRAIKLADIADLGDESISGVVTGSYILNTSSDSARDKYIVAAAMETDLNSVLYDSDDNIAYVVSARSILNMDTDEYYLQLTIIDENGVVTANTVDDVKDEGNNSAYEGETQEKLDDWAGTFVNYTINAEGVITMLETDIAGTYANVVSERNGAIFYYGEGVESFEDVEPSSNKYDEDGYVIVSIDPEEETYEGGTLNKLSKSALGVTLSEDGYNAVIFFDDTETDKVEKVFSFAPGILPVVAE